MTGAVRVLFVTVAVETVDNKTPLLPDGSVRVFDAASECGAAI